ncbi:hypothetical protein ACYYIN_002939, partial [Listeria monocytogenes]
SVQDGKIRFRFVFLKATSMSSILPKSLANALFPTAFQLNNKHTKIVLILLALYNNTIIRRRCQ